MIAVVKHKINTLTNMELHVIDTGNFKLDGGAMFGVVPKVMWQKLYPADENNLCTWTMRCLLIVTDDRKILIDCGIGEKQEEKFLKNYHLSGDASLEKSLKNAGFSNADITDVILTHLHFDHCGGAVKYNSSKTELIPTFNNAIYWVSQQQWDLANHPNQREKASYLKENFQPLNENGKIRFVENDSELYPGISVRIFNGHTAGQLIPFIKYNDKTIVYMADFIPAAAHIPLPFIISYDTQPLVSLAEKESFLKEAVKGDYTLFFEHDVYNECCNLHETEKGIRANKSFQLKEIF